MKQSLPFMIREKIKIQNKLGLHTRAAAKLVAAASRFESQIQLEHHGQIADCKSIMSVILLGLTQGITLDLIVSGTDELEARETIVHLVNSRFGEKE